MTNEKEKGFFPGKRTSIRFPVDYPQDVIDFLNEENAPLTDIIVIGARELMNQQNKGLFIKFDDLTPEEKAKIENSPELQRAAAKFIKEFFFSDKPFFKLIAENEREEGEISEEELREQAEQAKAELDSLGVDFDDDDDF